MSRKKTSRTAYAKNTKREQNPIPWKYCLLTLVCGLFLVTGFFFAARQHFSSIDYSIKNSKLKKQIEELESDKRRLVLAKEIALSPGEIKRAAKKIGLQEMTASNIAVFPVAVTQQVKSLAEKVNFVKPKQEILSKPEETKEAVKKDEKKPANTVVKEEKKTPNASEKQEKPKTLIAKK